MIKSVIFDLDGTLYDYDTAHALGYDALVDYARRELGMDRETFGKAYRKAMKDVSRSLGMETAALHDRYLRFQVMAENEGFPYSPHVFGMTDAYWEIFLDSMRPSPGVEQALEALSKAGLRIGLGTNMVIDYQLKKLERLGLIHAFDFIVSSEETLVEKPHPRFFARCVEKAGADPEECLFVGDDLVLDYMGAKGAGLQAAWFQGSGKEPGPQKPDLVFHDFRELPELCANMAHRGNTD